jgi:hypothetical protein
MNNMLVFSGYAKCKNCSISLMTFQISGACSQCERREFEYGVMHVGEFLSYSSLKVFIEDGQTCIDGMHDGRAITISTFQK